MSHSRDALQGLEANEVEPVILFLHIPKTGGTTVENILYGQAEIRYPDLHPPVDHQDGWIARGAFFFHGVLLIAENELAGFLRQPTRPPSPELIATLSRDDVRIVAGHFWFGLHRYVSTPSTYITFLRDPVDRVVSLYYHLVKYPDYAEFHRNIARNKVGLADFVSKIGCKEADNDQTRRISGLDPEFGSCSEEMLEVAKSNIRSRFSLVGTTERFDETILLAARRFGWTTPHYWRKQVNPERPGRHLVDEDTIARIARQNELDIALYDYANSLLDEAVARQGPDFPGEVERFRAANPRHTSEDAPEYPAGERPGRG